MSFWNSLIVFFFFRTQHRPDVILVSNTMKKVIISELSVSWKENMADSHERKLTKYQELVKQSKMKRWQVHCDLIEISGRGFVARSLCKALFNLGLAGRNKTTSIRLITDTTERILVDCGLREQVVSTEWTIIIFFSLPGLRLYLDTTVWQTFI